jgi:hypothetical protein
VAQGGEDLGLQIVKCVFEFDSPIDRSHSPFFLSLSSHLALSVDGDLCAVVFYAMGGDKAGSYFMETVVDCARSPPLLHLPLFLLSSSSLSPPLY